jgi:hypothetical protein
LWTSAARFRGADEPGSPASIFEDLEDFFDQGLAFIGREVARMDGLFVGLEVAQACLFGQIPVY